MNTVNQLDALRTRISQWRNAGSTVAFVPTMGNLHEGHLNLVREASKQADRVVVSIFVNPLQFGEGEDFDSYPRTLDADSALLEAEGADLLFAPPVGVMYPKPREQQTRVEVPGISNVLCGEFRPIHFVGVATVVCKLFNMVQPDMAFFGKKDYQQLMVIRLMVEDLQMPVRIIGIDTVRESDGLAMSSRNAYMTEAERSTAPVLYRLLQQSAEKIKQGESDLQALQATAIAELQEQGFRPDYFAIRRSRDLQPAQQGEGDLVILVAAYLGKTRLIDNLEVS